MTAEEQLIAELNLSITEEITKSSKSLTDMTMKVINDGLKSKEMQLTPIQTAVVTKCFYKSIELGMAAFVGGMSGNCKDKP